MSTFNFQPDDPRLTAYALGELDPNERAEVEAMLAESAEARTTLEEIRETIGLLSRELTFEPTLTLTMTQRQAVEQAVGVEGPASETRATVVAPTSVKPARWVMMARTATTVAAVAAVAVAVPYVSRSLWFDSASRATLESTIASVERTTSADSSRAMPREAMEMAGMSGGLSAENASADLSPSGTAGKDLLSTNNESLAQLTMPEPRRASGELRELDSLTDAESNGAIDLSFEKASASDPVAGVAAGHRELAESMLAQSSSATPESSAVKKEMPDGDASESKSSGPASGVGVGGDPLLAVSGEASGKGDSPAMSGLVSSVDESAPAKETELLAELRAGVASAESEVERLSEELGRRSEHLNEAVLNEAVLDAARLGAVRSKERSKSLSEPSVTSARGGLGAGGFGGHVDSLELRLLEENVRLRTDLYFRFRRLNAAVPGTEAYEPIVENAFLTPMEQPLSTFSIDVDTASYANMRRFIQQGQLPPANAVRVEELVNYFRYDYPEPADGGPFSVKIDVATCPWNPQNKLARVGLKAKTIAEDKRPATNLVFLIDVSGSMAAENKLPLVKQALNVLVSKMGEDDQIAIVTYAGEAGLKLNSTSGSQRAVIQQAIDSLQSGGSTNGAAGINIAYDTAIQSFIKGGANRVILCTDGDFNVGVSDDNTLVEMIQEKAASGVFLSVFGFGMGNLKDAKLEKLADKGNGNYGYIDGLGEARKVFGEQLIGTLVTVAKDVKLQLEFNNSTVGGYRLIGYENRVLAAKDFDDDTKDAGEIGAGHTVTALYEIVPKAAWLTQAGLDPKKFDIVEKPTANDETKEAADGRLFTVELRHKLPDAETSEKSQDYAAMNSDAQLSDSNVDFRFAAAVASFGMQLRESKFRGNWTLQNVLSMADASLATDRNGERTEFTDLVRGVMRLKGDSVTDPRLTTHETVAPATPAAELPTELSANDARIKATVDGKYRRLLKKIEVRSDVATYGEFRDFGHWDGTDYFGHSDLPAGYWVWVYPNWYIWGDVVGTEHAIE